MVLKRSDILSRTDLPTRTVRVPEWGGDVIVRTLTAGERDEFEIGVRQAREDGEEPHIRATLVAMAAVDEDGRRLFTDGDIPELAAKSSKAVDRIFAVAQRLAGMTPDDVDELEKKITRVADPDVHAQARRDAGEVDRGDRTPVGAGAGGMDGVPSGPPAG